MYATILYVITSPCILPLGTLVAALILREWLLAGQIRPEAGCGNCGYSIYGLPTDVCPECGAELTTVGIRRPGLPRPLSGGQRIAVWGIGWSGTIWICGVLLWWSWGAGFHWMCVVPLGVCLAAFVGGLFWRPVRDVAESAMFMNHGEKPPIKSQNSDSDGTGEC